MQRVNLSIIATILVALVPTMALAQNKKLTLSDLTWISGCWKANEKDSKVRNIEMWSKPHANVMVGVGVEERGGKANSWEHMRIEAKDDGSIVYTAKPHNQKEASFTLTSTSADTLVFENPKHDFPQKITYRKQKDGSLEMRIDGKVSGKDRAALFPMLRSTCE